MGVELGADRPPLMGEPEPVLREPTAVYLVAARAPLVDRVVLIVDEVRGHDRPSPVEDALIPRATTLAESAERVGEKCCGNAEQLSRPGPRSGATQAALRA